MMQLFIWDIANLISKLNFYKNEYPIQWTTALPVGMTGPPNARKRRPVYTTGRTGHRVCIH